MEWYKLWKSAAVGAVLVVMLGLAGCESSLERYRKEGVRLYDAKQYDQSLAALNQALSYDQFDAVSNAYAGMIQYRQDNLQQAEYHFRLALDGDPSSEEAKSGLTATLVKQGKPDLAMDALERAAKVAEGVEDPRGLKTDWKRPYTKQVEERLFLGKVNDRIRIAAAYESLLGDYDNALTYYKKALELAEKTESDATVAGIYMSVADMGERARNPALTKEYLKLAYLKDPSLPGLTAALTRNGVAISEVIGVPKQP